MMAVCNTNTNEATEYVTMDILKELLDQQRIFYEEMLERQENAFCGVSQIILNSINKKVDSRLGELQGQELNLYIVALLALL